MRIKRIVGTGLNDNLSLWVGDKEMMRFEPDGRIFVRGEQVDDNKAVYEEFLRWLQRATKGPTGGDA